MLIHNKSKKFAKRTAYKTKMVYIWLRYVTIHMSNKEFLSCNVKPIFSIVFILLNFSFMSFISVWSQFVAIICGKDTGEITSDQGHVTDFVKHNLWPQLLLFCHQIPIWACLSLLDAKKTKGQLVSCHCCSHAEHSLRMTLLKCFCFGMILAVVQQGLLVLSNRIFLLLLS